MTGLTETKTMDTDELFPTFLSLPTCAMSFKNEAHMVFACHKNNMHKTIPHSILLANILLARQNRRRKKAYFEDHDDNNGFVSDSEILQCLDISLHVFIYV